MDTKHTPGPWFYTGKHNDCEVRYVGTNREDRYHEEVATLYHGEGEEQIANARLIAAAPELLGALQDAFSMIDGTLLIDTFGSEWFEEASEAIAKATGEQA
jgi:hypothetical protein